MNINLRLTEETQKMIRQLAYEEKRSINSEILYLIEKYYNEKNSPIKEDDNKKNN